MLEARDVDAMSIEDLRAEVWFWREEAAADLSFRIGELKSGKSAGGSRLSRGRLADRIQVLASLLGKALTGDYFDACDICGGPMIPGQAMLSDADMGEVHAMCEGGDGRTPIQPGDKVFMDPESIVWEGEGPKPDHLVAHERTRLYTTEQLAGVVAVAREALQPRRRPMPPRGILIGAAPV